MPTITMTYDTLTKKAAVAVDGRPVADLGVLCLSRRWLPEPADPLYEIELVSHATQPGTGMAVTTRVTADAAGRFVRSLGGQK